MILNNIKVKILFLIAIDNGANPYVSLLKNYSKEYLYELIDEGLVRTCGVNNRFLEVTPEVSSLVNQFISSAADAIEFGMSIINNEVI